MRSLQHVPSHVLAHNALGCSLLERNRVRAACDSFRRALRHGGGFAEARSNLGRALLTLGEFEEGWKNFEYVHTSHSMRHGGRKLESVDFAGKTVLLYGEGGLGNIIQFARYATLLAERGAMVVFESPLALAGLLRTVPGVSHVIVDGEAPPPFHAHGSIMSLPRIFGTTLDTIPNRVPYLSADAVLIERWGERLLAIEGFKIGVVWQAEQRNPYGKLRTVPLAHFAVLAQVPGVRLISLQKDWRGFAAFGLTAFPELDTASGPFMDTAAIMRNLDLVITADTSTAHLSGALGVPVWVAIRHAPDWRWMLDREDSPWYRTMRLFRQTRPGIWRDVFERMAESLRTLTGG
jgi:hypothetical protein